MNKVEKSDNVPATLATRGVAETELLRKCVAADEPYNIKAAVYAAPDVKDQLKTDQHGKCAYCERYFNGDYGAVEHFRPKAAYQQGPGAPICKPGYYWLAYDWQNLLYSCSECNTGCKRNLFPLADDAQRNIASEDIDKEQPMLLNPAKDEIGDFIEFHRHMIVAKNSAPSKDKAEKTIGLLRLNDRRDLVARRKGVWETYQTLCKIREIAELRGDEDEVEGIESIIAGMQSEESEFTGMFKYQGLYL